MRPAEPRSTGDRQPAADARAGRGSARRPGARGRRTSPGSPWAVMLRWGAVPAGVLAAVLAIAALLISGTGAMGSTLLAAVVVAVPFGLSGLALWWASGLSAYAPPIVMLGLYAALVVLGAMLMQGAEAPSWLVTRWAGAAAAGQVAVWLGGMAAGLSRARLPLFDVAAPAASAPAAHDRRADAPLRGAEPTQGRAPAPHQESE